MIGAWMAFTFRIRVSVVAVGRLSRCVFFARVDLFVLGVQSTMELIRVSTAVYVRS